MLPPPIYFDHSSTFISPYLKNSRKFHMRPLHNLQFERNIGSGTFGKVRRAVHVPTGKPVAVKVLNKQRINSKKDAARIEREITILKRINHPNLLKLFQLIETQKSYMLVTQLVQGEELYHRINRKGGLPEEEAGEWFVQLLDAVMHLNKRGIAHRDVKPQNIIVSGTKLTLIDYGLGNLYASGERLTTSCGSHCYAAPEMMNSKSYDPEKTEVWALGVTLYAMLSGKLPFEEELPSKLLKQMLSNDYEQLPNIPPALKELLRGMIEAKSGKRLTLQQIKQNRWVRAMQHDFIDQEAKGWDEGLLRKMSQQFGLSRSQLIWRIEQSFQEESISYYLRIGQQTEEYPFHSGPVHLNFIFKAAKQAQDYIKSHLPECKWVAKGCAVQQRQSMAIKQIKGGFFYICAETI